MKHLFSGHTYHKLKQQQIIGPSFRGAKSIETLVSNSSFQLLVSKITFHLQHLKYKGNQSLGACNNLRTLMEVRYMLPNGPLSRCFTGHQSMQPGCFLQRWFLQAQGYKRPMNLNPPKTNMTGWEHPPWMKMDFLLKMNIFQCHVSFLGCKPSGF